MAVRRFAEKQAQEAQIGQLPGVVQLVHQLGLAPLLKEGKFRLREGGGLDDFRQAAHELAEILGQAFQAHQGGVPAPPGIEGGSPGFEVLGQLKLAAPLGAQGEEFRGPVRGPGLPRRVGLGPPFGHEGEAHPGHPVVLHPQQIHAVGQGGLVDFRDVV
ncbi:MAG: hypothetical protein A3K23_04030 [Desulfobacca sp. RBG_16_58_9]|nr:MAG: hypothetical protein A3K23_04030 [Desulfobacca sp. RBG_16_58_9]